MALTAVDCGTAGATECTEKEPRNLTENQKASIDTAGRGVNARELTVRLRVITVGSASTAAPQSNG